MEAAPISDQAPAVSTAADRVCTGIWLVGALAIAGLGLFWWQFLQLYALWTSDSLSSIGALVIPTSLVLGWRALDREDFLDGGSGWGLVPIALALAGASVAYHGTSILVLTRGIGPDLLPTGLLLFLYSSGVVVLLGGISAWRKARFPLFLLLFVKPVPGFFTVLVDLPLQRLDAQLARGFADWLQVPVSGSTLNLLFFHNELGMFIAPGCNGLRGVAAMGLLAAVIGHLRGWRIIRELLFITAAVTLAYVFNLFRLCALVLYYCLAHRWPLLGAYAVGADYAIGALLFAAAAAFLFWVPRLRTQ